MEGDRVSDQIKVDLENVRPIEKKSVCVQVEGVSVGFDRALYLSVQMDRVIC